MCACSMSVNSWAECEKLLSYVRWFASARESDLSNLTQDNSSAQELTLMLQAHTNPSPLQMQLPLRCSGHKQPNIGQQLLPFSQGINTHATGTQKSLSLAD